MKRIFGTMPIHCIELRKTFKDKNGFKLTIEAGSEGWTVIYADHSTNYADAVDTAENNFKKAYDTAVNNVGLLEECNEEKGNERKI